MARARNRFVLDLQPFLERARTNPRLVVKKVVIDAGSSVVLKTPVGDADQWERPAPPGYVGGRARGSWQYSKDEPLEVEPGGLSHSGQAPIGRIVAGVSTGDPACEHFIVSNVPYMRPLEYEGHSRQAPEGMVRKTIAEFQDYVDNAIQELP